jgi:hypothetical protein
MIVPHGYALAGEVTQLTTVYFVSNKENDALAALAQDFLLDEESAKVVWTESLSPYLASLCLRDTRSAGDELGVIVNDNARSRGSGSGSRAAG